MWLSLTLMCIYYGRVKATYALHVYARNYVSMMKGKS
jgi:hypothetical protein